MLIMITDREGWASRLSPLLLGNGIYHLCVPTSFATFACEREDTGAVILDCVPSLSRGEHICADLKRRYPDMPVAIVAAPEMVVNAHADAVLRDGNLETLCKNIASLCQANGWSAPPLSTYYLRLTPPDRTDYMGLSLSLSPAEFRILHCIFYRSPHPTDSEHLVALCAGEGASSEESLAVLIHRINQKAAEIDPRPLVVNEYGKGYRLRDGIL
ncbi:MAG: winged helix-turn-helix domain-containing protein [Clostridia bacterium]|nr:winged helix-turn-helix domain-containing protein [Clostridia bacterium]